MVAEAFEDFQRHGARGLALRLLAQTNDNPREAGAVNRQLGVAQHVLQRVRVGGAAVNQPVYAAVAQMPGLLLNPLFQKLVVRFHAQKCLGQHLHAVPVGVRFRHALRNGPQRAKAHRQKRKQRGQPADNRPQERRQDAANGLPRLGAHGALRRKNQHAHAVARQVGRRNQIGFSVQLQRLHLPGHGGHALLQHDGKLRAALAHRENRAVRVRNHGAAVLLQQRHGQLPQQPVGLQAIHHARVRNADQGAGQRDGILNFGASAPRRVNRIRRALEHLALPIGKRLRRVERKMRVIVFFYPKIALSRRNNRIGAGQIHKIAADNAAAVAEQGQHLNGVVNAYGQASALTGRASHQRLQLL